MWAPYGLALLYLQNAMPQDVFEFMQHYIDFCNNRDKYPLYKVKWLLQQLMSGMNNAWIAFERVTIDKSMIK